MMTSDNFHAILERITHGTPAPGDIEVLKDALSCGEMRIEIYEMNRHEAPVDAIANSTHCC